MLRILAILFGLTAALNVNTAEAGVRRRLAFVAPVVAAGAAERLEKDIFSIVDSVRKEKGDAEDKMNMKKSKMYKKFAKMDKKKLMGMIKKYQEKIAIMKKVLKGMKKDKKN